MLVALIAVGAFAATVVVLVAALALPWAGVTRKRVLVHTPDATFDGILWARRGPLLVLRDAKVVGAGAEMPVDGEVVVERRAVQWMQVLR